jgi:purine-nucleoside phosphorylase
MMNRDIHISPKDLLNSMQFKEGDFADIAIVCGQPQRAMLALEKLENPVKNFSAFGYTFWTGKYNGKRVTVGNGGYYAPDSALVTELLCVGGVNNIIRLGSCGSLKKEIAVGDYVLAEKALRGDGVTKYYVDESYIPTSDIDLNNKLCNLLENTHKGMVWTTDALLKETKEIVNDVINKGAIAVDMITSAFLTIANVYKKKATALLVVSDNLITGELGFSSIKFFDAEKKMIDKSFDIIDELL